MSIYFLFIYILSLILCFSLLPPFSSFSSLSFYPFPIYDPKAFLSLLFNPHFSFLFVFPLFSYMFECHFHTTIPLSKSNKQKNQ